MLVARRGNSRGWSQKGAIQSETTARMESHDEVLRKAQEFFLDIVA